MENNVKRHRFSVKVLSILIAIAAVIAGLCLLFLHEKVTKHAILAETSTVFDNFFYNGNAYTLSTATENYSKQRTILRPADSDSEFLILPGENAKWCAEIDSFVYADGKKICICNIDGSDRRTIYKISGSGSASLRDVIGNYAIIRQVTNVKFGASEGDGVYFFIDLESGKPTPTEITAYTGISPITISDGWFYYGTGSLDGDYVDIRRCSLETGKCEIVTDEIDEYISHYGCVSDGYLYFHYEYGDVFRVLVGGGKIENLNLRFDDIGAKGAAGLISYKDTVLVACLCRNADAEVSFSVFSLAQDNRKLHELVSFNVDGSYHLSSMRIQGNIFIASSINPPVFLYENL